MLALARGASAEGVGEGTRARSALGRVGVPSVGEAGKLAAAVDLSGGYTESLSSGDSAHTRVAASAAAAIDAARFLNLGLWLGGRYDRHAHGDDGLQFNSELSARLAWRFGGLGVGVEGGAWLPGGKDIGSSFSAVSADGKLLLSGHTPSLVVAGFAGYRLDRSSEAAGDASRLSLGDRSALGASDYNALLLGLGAGYVTGKTTLFGEAAAQLLLGSPKLAASPVFATLGARQQLGGGLSAELSVTGLLSARPDLSPSAPLFPVEPRATLALGLRYRFGDSPPPPPLPPPPPPDKPVVVPPPPPPPATVELSLLDDRGQPLKRAQVVVTQDGVDTPLVETEPGRYRLENAKPGKAHLRAQAEGFKPIEQDIDVGVGKPVHVDAHAEQALPAGQVRGLVRSFRGKALAASIHLEPGAVEAKTDAEGFFQIDVPPGDYEVVIEAPGYEPQRRKAKVDQQGVVIVNADLVQKK